MLRSFKIIIVKRYFKIIFLNNNFFSKLLVRNADLKSIPLFPPSSHWIPPSSHWNPPSSYRLPTVFLFKSTVFPPSSPWANNLVLNSIFSFSSNNNYYLKIIKIKIADKSGTWRTQGEDGGKTVHFNRKTVGRRWEDGPFQWEDGGFQ